MGYMRHHAIVITGLDVTVRGTPSMRTIHKRIEEITHTAKHAILCVSPLTQKATNGWRSFFVAPDGSKEGWDTSTNCDIARAQIVEYLDSIREDGWCPVDWVEIQFGDDDGVTKIIGHSDQKKRNRKSKKASPR